MMLTSAINLIGNRSSLWENHLRVAAVLSAKPQTKFASSNFHPQTREGFSRGIIEDLKEISVKNPKCMRIHSAIAVNSNHVRFLVATSQKGKKKLRENWTQKVVRFAWRSVGLWVTVSEPYASHMLAGVAFLDGVFESLAKGRKSSSCNDEIESNFSSHR